MVELAGRDGSVNDTAGGVRHRTCTEETEATAVNQNDRREPVCDGSGTYTPIEGEYSDDSS
ncbi:hypothetical protein D3C76_1467560 [compost metagenome]